MNRKLTVVALAAVCSGGLAPLAAEEPAGLPKVLQIYREEVKPGKGAAHEKLEAGWPAAFRKAGVDAYYLAMTSNRQAWFVTPWESFGAAEKAGKAMDANAVLAAEQAQLSTQDGELISDVNGIWATLQKDISYRTDWDTAKMRYFVVTTVRLNPGYGAEYESIRKLVNEAHDKAKVDEHWGIYQVQVGASAGTYLIFAPMASMAEMDKLDEMHGKAYQEALGEQTRQRLRDFTRVGVKSSETQIFSFSPKMSFLSKEFMARDPEFWSPKPAAAPAKKDEKK
jgi:hypothetical protein